jgi:hypothetical protein
MRRLTGGTSVGTRKQHVKRFKENKSVLYFEVHAQRDTLLLLDSAVTYDVALPEFGPPDCSDITDTGRIPIRSRTEIRRCPFCGCNFESPVGAHPRSRCKKTRECDRFFEAERSRKDREARVRKKGPAIGRCVACLADSYHLGPNGDALCPSHLAPRKRLASLRAAVREAGRPKLGGEA